MNELLCTSLCGKTTSSKWSGWGEAQRPPSESGLWAFAPANRWRRRQTRARLRDLLLLMAISLLTTSGPVFGDESDELPMTGTAVAEMTSFDRGLCRLMRKWDIPGGALAVVKDGRLVLARGYGLADVDTGRPVEPDSLFRIASVSKPITAAAVLVLVEQGRLDLDAHVLELLDGFEPPQGTEVDPRLRQITVRHLLHHTGGFDRRVSFDPMLSPPQITEALGTLAENRPILRFMLGRPLDFDPGTRYAYSNFGYSILGRVIEQVTGQSYAQAVQTLVLQPAGITRMRLGHTRRADRADGEVCYYPHDGARPVESVFPDQQQPVSEPYGRFYIDAMDAHGGWIASASDLVRFAASLDGARARRLLADSTLHLIESRPAPPVSQEEPAYYGLGWMIRPEEDSANWWHAGSLPGTRSYLVRTHHGLIWAVVFNSRPRSGESFALEVDRALWQAAGEVKTWPQHDLFIE